MLISHLLTSKYPYLRDCFVNHVKSLEFRKIKEVEITLELDPACKSELLITFLMK